MKTGLKDQKANNAVNGWNETPKQYGIRSDIVCNISNMMAVCNIILMSTVSNIV